MLLGDQRIEWYIKMWVYCKTIYFRGSFQNKRDGFESQSHGKEFQEEH